MLRFLLSAGTLFLMLQNVTGQILKPVKWTFEINQLTNNEYELIYKASIQKGWSVYSQYTSDDGPVPTSVTYESSEGITLVGKATESGTKKEGIDSYFGVNVIKYLADKPYVITQKIKVRDPSKPIIGYVNYMACDHEKCLPPTDVDFEFKIPSSPQSKPAADAVSGTLNSEKLSQLSTPAPEAVAQSPEIKGAAMLSPVKWDITREKVSDNIFDLVFRAMIDKGWTVYSVYTSDDGPVPTTINFENEDGFRLVDKAIESGTKKQGPDPLFDNVVVIKFYHDKPYEIRQRIEITDDTKPVTGYLNYMTCDDKQCLPPTDVEFGFAFSPAAEALMEGNNLAAKISGDKINQKIESLESSFQNPIGNCGEEDQKKEGLLWTFIFGFIGGMLALLTPCVFPMLPITISFFTKDTKRKGWVNGVLYGISIIVIYILIGLLITIFVGPEALNRLSTNWIANTAFFLIFIAFAFSFFGYYEITLPSSWSTKSDQMADKGGLIGIFFMAFTLALVSFSCTGPIIGTAIVQAATKGEYLGPFLVMFGFSSALALPFGLFAAFPAWLNTLPKSGSWMNSVKVVLGFLELALALKFLSVADMTNGWGFLKYELFMGLWIIIFIGMTLYLFGFIKFPHDSPLKKLSPVRISFALASAALVVYLITGFRVNEKTQEYNALSLMSGLAPPAHYNFFMPAQELDQSIKSRYSSYSKCANNINCFKDYFEGIAYANEVNKPVMLDFTGHGCVNCRKTEEHIWVDDRIRSILNDSVVLISLYVDDDKKLDPVYISEITGEKLRNVGKKWADFQIVNFQQNSQPLYILATTDQKVLTQPRAFVPGIQGYLEFLQCGLQHNKTYKNQN
jgi:thiol:disulfide interchange protein